MPMYVALLLLSTVTQMQGDYAPYGLTRREGGGM